MKCENEECVRARFNHERWLYRCKEYGKQLEAYKNAYGLSAIYLAAPLIIFLFGWVELWLALPLVILLIFFLLRIRMDRPAEARSYHNDLAPEERTRPECGRIRHTKEKSAWAGRVSLAGKKRSQRCG